MQSGTLHALCHPQTTCVIAELLRSLAPCTDKTASVPRLKLASSFLVQNQTLGSSLFRGSKHSISQLPTDSVYLGTYVPWYAI